MRYVTHKFTIVPTIGLIMIEQFDAICDELRARYMKILSHYYPAHGSTGFTERNLTNNFVAAFEHVIGESCIAWFEAPICLDNGQHLDAVIFFESTTVLIESKRLTSVNAKFKSIANDVDRMFSPKTIELIEKELIVNEGQRIRYAIVLCDVWTETTEKTTAYNVWPAQLPPTLLNSMLCSRKLNFDKLDVKGDWKHNYKILVACAQVNI